MSMVLFSDLLSIQHDSRTGAIDEDALKCILPDTPEDVIQQVYRDHGRNSFFQAKYGRLRIDRLRWKLRSFSASKLIACSYNPEFRNFFEGRREWPKNFTRNGWDCVDVRIDVIEHWRTNRSWQRPPVLIDASLVLKRRGLYLIEGHSRLSILSGLVAQRVIGPASKHSAWHGTEL